MRPGTEAATGRNTIRLVVLFALVLATFAQGVTGVGPQQHTAAPAEAALCGDANLSVITDGVKTGTQTCAALPQDSSPATPGGSGKVTENGITYRPVVCNTLYVKSYKDGSYVNDPLPPRPLYGATGQTYDDYNWASRIPGSKGFHSDVWSGSWVFSTWECDYYKVESYQVEVCENVRYSRQVRRRRTVTTTGWHSTHSWHGDVVGHYGTYTSSYGNYSADGYHETHSYHNTTTGYHYGSYTTTEYYWDTEYDYVLECDRETRYQVVKYKDTYNEAWERKCTYACKTPARTVNRTDLSTVVPDPITLHDPAVPTNTAAAATFVNTDTRFWAANPAIDYLDVRDVDGDGNTSEASWIVLETRIDGPESDEWIHYTIVYPDRARIRVTGDENREWDTACSIERFADPDKGCSLSIDTGSIGTNFAGATDAYQVHADVRWRYYCQWEANQLYLDSSPRPRISGCSNSRTTTGGPTFSTTARDGTVYSESWQDPSISSEQNGDTGDPDLRIPLRVNEIQSTNRDT